MSEVYGGDGNDEIYGDVGPTPPPPATTSGKRRLRSLASVSSSGPYPCDDPETFPPNDLCYMDDETQFYSGGAGDDIVFGQRGTDVIQGDDGDDRLYGGIGDEDDLEGGNGDDLLSGGPGSDFLKGNGGGDIVRGDGNQDKELSGGSGIDTISFATGATPGFTLPAVVPCGGNGACPGFPSSADGRGVTIDLSKADVAGYQAGNGNALSGGGNDEFDSTFENVVGTAFADLIIGDANSNTITGGGGADIILGGGENDTLAGNADGDYLDGEGGTDSLNGGTGAASGNFCTNGEANSQCGASSPGVVPRDNSKIAVGMIQAPSGSRTYSMIYLTGTPGNDVVEARVDSDYNITFTTAAGAPSFDPGQEGCDFNNANQVTCDPSSLDAVVLAGLDGNDTLNGDTVQSTDYDFSGVVSLMLLGGNGSDQLHGAEDTEDVLVDGLDAGGDALWGYGHDDALIGGAGADNLIAGDDNDVLVTSAICDGGQYLGQGGSDNVAWAQVQTPRRSMTNGVWANLDDELAGRTGVAGTIGLSCPGGAVSDLIGVENLEGTNGRDALIGSSSNSELNYLLGRAGEDDLLGLGGPDRLQAYSGDRDGTLSGGGGQDKLFQDELILGDTLIDRLLTDNDPADLPPEAKPASWTGMTDIAIDKIDTASNPLAFFRLGERTQDIAYEGPSPSTSGSNGTYIDGPSLGITGAIADSDNKAIRLDGVDDRVSLTANWDPASYATTGYSFELWVKPNASQNGTTRYIFSRYNGTTGIRLYRNSTGRFVFDSLRSGVFYTATSTNPVTAGVWHHVVGTLNGNTSTLYIDNIAATTNAAVSVFPAAGSGVPNRLGSYPSFPFLAAEIDMLSIYNRALPAAEVAQHYALGFPAP